MEGGDLGCYLKSLVPPNGSPILGNPPASTPPEWAPAALQPQRLLPRPRARAPPSPGSLGILLAAGTAPAPGPLSAAPARPAPLAPAGRRRGCWRTGWLCRPCLGGGGRTKRGESSFGEETTGWASAQSLSGWLFSSPLPVSHFPFLFCTSGWKRSKQIQKDTDKETVDLF